MQVNHYYISPNKYSKQTGLGIEEVKKLCRMGRIPCEISEGGYYHIKVYKDDCVSRAEYNKVIKENTELKSLIKNINILTNKVGENNG